MNQELLNIGDTFYLLDMSKFKMFEMMPMTVPTPEPLPLFLRAFVDYAPKVHVPSFILTDPFGYDDITPEWSFVYLFPLGKRGYKRREKK